GRDEVIQGPVAQGLGGQLLVAVGGHQHHRRGDAFAGQRLDQFQPVHVGQLVVEQHQVVLVVPQDDQGVGGGAADGDVTAGALQVQPRQEGDFFLVLDQE